MPAPCGPRRPSLASGSAQGRSDGMTRVAFIGLGVMGFPMAGHLAAKGHEVTVYNRTPAKAEAWCAAASAARRPPARARRRRRPRSCSPASATTTTCARWPTARTASWPASARAGSSSTTPRPRPTSRASCAQAAGEQGAHFVDAPVSGGQAGAENGTLTIMCGGERGGVRPGRAGACAPTAGR